MRVNGVFLFRNFCHLRFVQLYF